MTNKTHLMTTLGFMVGGLAILVRVAVMLFRVQTAALQVAGRRR